MMKALAAVLPSLPTREGRLEGAASPLPLPWLLVASELGLALLLFLSDRLPPVLTRGLQLFLSF